VRREAINCLWGGAVALVVLSAACGSPSTLTVNVVAGNGIERPRWLAVTWLSDRGAIYEREDLPVTGEEPLASIVIELDRGDSSDRRILVRGKGPGGPSSIGALRIPLPVSGGEPQLLTLQAEMLDSDGDGVPDVIDDCSGGACAPPADAAPGSMGGAPEDAGSTAPDAGTPTDELGSGPDAGQSPPGPAADAGTSPDVPPPPTPLGGVVALWRMDEGQGTTVSDGSGHGNAGAIMRATGNDWGEGHRGTALALGGSAWMSVPASSRYDSTLGLTLSVWFFWAQSTNASQVIMARQRGTAWQNAFWLGMDGNRLHFSVEDQGLNVPVPSGRWVHVAGTYDGARVILYLDGVEAGRAGVSARPAGGARGISVGADINGADATAGTSMFVGRLDEVAIYDRALTAAEVGTLAEVR
jgi:hypothetical protein